MYLKRNHAEGWIDIHMPAYVIWAHEKFNHPVLAKSQHAPHPWVTPVYGARQQQNPKETSQTPLLDKEGNQRVQFITGKLLHYGHAVDPWILPDINKLAFEQAKTTIDTAIKWNMLMEYVHTNPKYFIRYHASDIILKVFSDSAFIVLRQSRSRSFDIYNLGRKDNKKQNGLIDVLCQTIKNVVASTSESE